MELDDLKCCGNCEYICVAVEGDLYCSKHNPHAITFGGISPWDKCDEWKFDNKSPRHNQS